MEPSGNPHRLLDLLYDAEYGVFLALHAQEFDPEAPHPDGWKPESMILSVYSEDWQPLQVFDTGFPPQVDDPPSPGAFAVIEPGRVSVCASDAFGGCTGIESDTERLFDYDKP